MMKELKPVYQLPGTQTSSRPHLMKEWESLQPYKEESSSEASEQSIAFTISAPQEMNIDTDS